MTYYNLGDIVGRKSGRAHYMVKRTDISEKGVFHLLEPMNCQKRNLKTRRLNEDFMRTQGWRVIQPHHCP